MAQAPTISVQTCEQLLSVATSSCTKAQVPSVAPRPDFDALATTFAAMSNQFALISILIGVGVIISGIGWGLLVRRQAMEEARRAADEWLTRNGPAVLREAAGYLKLDDGTQTSDSAKREDSLGQGAG